MGDKFVARKGLLVPADAVTKPAVDAADLRKNLVAARELVAVKREDEWVRRAQQAQHKMALADVDEHASAAERARQERALDAHEAEELANLYRQAARSGARARIRAQIQGSAEMRALRVAKVRATALKVGIPVLAAFAAWSTTGAQAGAVRLLSLTTRSAAWFASWGVEPALITIVALIIIGRAILRSSGGDTDWRAQAVEWAALGMSLALNIVGGWPIGAAWSDWTGIVTALPHAIGPVGCAGTALLISLFDEYVSQATPWEGAPRLSDLDLVPPAVSVVSRTSPGPGTDPIADLVPALGGPGADLFSDPATDPARTSDGPHDGPGPQPVSDPVTDLSTDLDQTSDGPTADPARTSDGPGTDLVAVPDRTPVRTRPTGGGQDIKALLPTAREVAQELTANGMSVSRASLGPALRQRGVAVSTTGVGHLVRALKSARERRASRTPAVKRSRAAA